MQPGAREAVEQSDAKRIYLYCEAPVLAARIEADAATAANRPSLTGQGGGLAEIEAVLAERDPVYRAVADEVFDVTHLNVEDGVRYLIERCLR
jgi:shikimate kinase